MKTHEENIDEVLGKVLHSTPQTEMEAAGARVLQRLRRDSGWLAEATPRAPVSKTWRLLAAAAAVASAVVLSIGFWPAGSAAVVEAADIGLYRVVAGKTQPLHIGEKVEMGETIRSDGAASSTLAIEDGSRIEMRSMSELALEDANDGLHIRLSGGSVIVSGAREPKWHLYVQTRDTRVSVGETVSLVTAEETGSRVAVIQGEARVEQGGTSKWLRGGEQLATIPFLEPRSIAEGISWSRRAPQLLPMVQQAAALLAPAVQAPVPEVPKWEAASIKPCDPNTPKIAGARGNNGVGENFTVTPGRFATECMRLSVLMNIAYVTNGEPLLNSTGLDRKDVIKGGPQWISSGKLSDRYSIEARAEGRPDRKVILGPMLRALLEDRFQLKSHRETEEIPMFGLVVAKGGLKIKPINPADCTPNDGAGFPAWLDQVRRGQKGFCSFVYGDDVTPGTTGWAFGGQTLANFAGNLSRWVRRPVIDQTGISGQFRFYLEVDSSVGVPMLPDGPAYTVDLPPGTQKGPDIFSAIQDQLGLKLVDAKGTHEFIVVDRAERPSEN